MSTTVKDFRNDVIIILSVFFIAVSVGVILGVSCLSEAKTHGRLSTTIYPPATATVTAAPAPLAESVAPSPKEVPPQTAATPIPPSAKLHRGEGIEHALIRQLREKHADKDLALARVQAHQIAVFAGFSGRTAEIRTRNGTRDIAYVLDEEHWQIVTFSDGEEVSRTSIATDSSHIQKVAPRSFEYVHHIPT